MSRLCRLILAIFLLVTLALPALAETRALLIACSDFVTQPDLGSAISGNLHMIGSALLGATPSLAGLSIEDGTIGTPSELESAILDAFAEADEEDLSLIYLCTHGILSSADDEGVYLLLGNGKTDTPLSGAELYRQLSGIQGEKLLILDACYSGALLSRGIPQSILLPGTRMTAEPISSPFLADTSIHVLTSAFGNESSWYYDSKGLQTGAVSYFASALSSGLGLYGSAEADADGDGQASLTEIHRYLSAAVPSSSCQLLSARADSVFLPTAQIPLLSRPLSGFSYGASLLTADDPALDFSFTVTSEANVQYRLIEYENGVWNWAQAQTFLDSADSLPAGRHSRCLTLPTVAPADSGYLMLQVFSIAGEEVTLCSERLIAVQPSEIEPVLSINAPNAFPAPGQSELPIEVSAGCPAEITVTIYDAQGNFIARPAASELTRPSKDHKLHVYWDGRDANGKLASPGSYTIAAETQIGFSRVKSAHNLLIGTDNLLY